MVLLMNLLIYLDIMSIVRHGLGKYLCASLTSVQAK
jgi:hypothetical protein